MLLFHVLLVNGVAHMIQGTLVRVVMDCCTLRLRSFGSEIQAQAVKRTVQNFKAMSTTAVGTFSDVAMMMRMNSERGEWVQGVRFRGAVSTESGVVESSRLTVPRVREIEIGYECLSGSWDLGLEDLIRFSRFRGRLGSSSRAQVGRLGVGGRLWVEGAEGMDWKGEGRRACISWHGSLLRLTG